MGGQLDQSVIRETHWAEWMRCAIAGDADAYQRFLRAVTPSLRTISRGHCELLGLPTENAEDIVQEILLTIHFKRCTWKSSRPIGPWISSLVSSKLAAALRRHIAAPNVMRANESAEQERRQGCIGAFLSLLNERQRKVVLLISIEGAGIRETADRLFLSEREVQLALHGSLKKLVALFRNSPSQGPDQGARHQSLSANSQRIVGEALDGSRSDGQSYPLPSKV